MLGALAIVRPDERRGTLAAALTIFGTLAAHTLLETARDALFLARLPASRLAFVYLGIAAVAVALSQLPRGRGLCRRPVRAEPAARRSGSLVTLAFWLLGRWQSPFELYALYVWTGLLGSLAVLQFWMVLGELYTLTQAKRLVQPRLDRQPARRRGGCRGGARDRRALLGVQRSSWPRPSCSR